MSSGRWRFLSTESNCHTGTWEVSDLELLRRRCRPASLPASCRCGLSATSKWLKEKRIQKGKRETRKESFDLTGAQKIKYKKRRRSISRSPRQCLLTAQVCRHNRLQEYETFIFSFKKRQNHAYISIRLSSATQEENFKKKEKKERDVVNAHWDAADLRAAIKEEQLCLLLISSDEHSTESLPFISAARPAAQPLLE